LNPLIDYEAICTLSALLYSMNDCHKLVRFYSSKAFKNRFCFTTSSVPSSSACLSKSSHFCCSGISRYLKTFYIIFQALFSPMVPRGNSDGLLFK